MVKFVKNVDLLKAYMRWEKAMPPLMRCKGDWESFLGFENVGLTIPKENENFISWEIPDIGAERIELINNSPHWYAILRAMAIKEADALFRG